MLNWPINTCVNNAHLGSYALLKTNSKMQHRSLDETLSGPLQAWNFIPASLIFASKARGLYYKTLWVCNLRENDKYCSKLAYSGLDKHTSFCSTGRWSLSLALDTLRLHPHTEILDQPENRGHSSILFATRFSDETKKSFTKMTPGADEDVRKFY